MEHLDHFSIYWKESSQRNFIIPTDEVIFFRGVGQPPTSYWCMAVSHIWPMIAIYSRSILHGYFNPLVFWYHWEYLRSPAKNLFFARYLRLAMMVVWNTFYVSIYWECHHSNWRSHIFQRGRSTTNHLGNQPTYFTTFFGSSNHTAQSSVGFPPGDL